MRVLVLQFHPLEASLSTAVLDAVVRGAAGHDTSVVRLADHPGPAAAELVGYEALLAVHPTWWGGLPAPLLAWVQDTLGPWIDGPAPRFTSPLRNVTRLMAVTTHGSPRWTNLLQGEPGRHLWARRVAPICASGTSARWLAHYNVDRGTDAGRRAFLGEVTRTSAALLGPASARPTTTGTASA